MIKSNYAYVIIHYFGMYNPTTTIYYIWDCDGWKSHVDGFLYDIACTDETKLVQESNFETFAT